MSRSKPEPAIALAQEAGGVGLVDGPLAGSAGRAGELAADVDERVVHAEGVGGDGRPLDQLVRVALEQLAVLEGAGLGLVGVHHQVERRGVRARKPHLTPAGEAGPAPAPQVGRLHLGGHLLRGHLPQRPAQRLVAAGGQVALQGVAVFPVRLHAREEDGGHAGSPAVP